MRSVRVAALTILGLVGICTGLAGAAGASAEAPAEPRSGAPKSPAYEKPFLSRGSASLGGYMDFQFGADDRGSGFDLARFVPFIYARVSDRVHLASEIEFEHGGFVTGEDEATDGEIKVEFATIDFAVAEALNFRGGLILSPLGRLNELHDAPMLDLTERPLVDRFVIPTTLSESGLGLYGTAYPSEQVVVNYEAYLVNGFDQDVLVLDGSTTPLRAVLDLHEGRGSAAGDNNNSRAFVGRVGLSPRLGTEVGLSVHTGKFDDAGTERLTLAAVDARFARGRFELVGEGALARTGKLDLQGAGDAVASERAKAAGFYAEVRLHVLAGAIRSLPQSVFTAAARADYVDRDANVAGADRERLTLGINFRPSEETAVKNDVLFDRGRAAGGTEWGDSETSYRFSVATYF